MAIKEKDLNSAPKSNQRLTVKMVLIIIGLILIPNLILQLIFKGLGANTFGLFLAASLITFLIFLLFNFLFKKTFKGKLPIIVRFIFSMIVAYAVYYFIMYLSGLTLVIK
jgi:hypothetical protein